MEQVIKVHNGAKKPRKPNMSHQSKERRRRVIERLEQQLKSGKKTINLLKTGYAYEPLIEGDIKRIKKELETLKSRI